MDVTNDVEIHLGREVLFDGKQELPGLGFAQVSLLDVHHQGYLFVQAAVQPAVDHVTVVLIHPDQQAAQRAEHHHELQQGVGVEIVVQNVQDGGHEKEEKRHGNVTFFDRQPCMAAFQQAYREHQGHGHDGAAAHVDQGHFQAAEQGGADSQVAHQQVQDVLQDGKTAAHGRSANDAVNEEGNLFATGQPPQGEGFHRLFHDGIKGVGNPFRYKRIGEPEQPETGRCGQQACSYQQHQVPDAHQGEIVERVHDKNVEDYRKEGNGERHYRSFKEIINSLPWRPPGKPSGANRWPYPIDRVVFI